MAASMVCSEEADPTVCAHLTPLWHTYSSLRADVVRRLYCQANHCLNQPPTGLDRGSREWLDGLYAESANKRPAQRGLAKRSYCNIIGCMSDLPT
ncbi:unnamed protein product [Protopolystoma xenopodis]|uniref:Uncharacterized protein n=1 Tax=Protopolystoma xenopodis TaxID=117903 RepID=A0A448WMZ8_9PLAT|nr:unnamed protein product [Protopolystoma xenopodis]